ncbi:hypothetical protein [Geopseudomonas aromaticivorans]
MEIVIGGQVTADRINKALEDAKSKLDDQFSCFADATIIVTPYDVHGLAYPDERLPRGILNYSKSRIGKTPLLSCEGAVMVEAVLHGLALRTDNFALAGQASTIRGEQRERLLARLARMGVNLDSAASIDAELEREAEKGVESARAEYAQLAEQARGLRISLLNQPIQTPKQWEDEKQALESRAKAAEAAVESLKSQLVQANATKLERAASLPEPADNSATIRMLEREIERERSLRQQDAVELEEMRAKLGAYSLKKLHDQMDSLTAKNQDLRRQLDSLRFVHQQYTKKMQREERRQEKALSALRLRTSCMRGFSRTPPKFVASALAQMEWELNALYLHVARQLHKLEPQPKAAVVEAPSAPQASGDLPEFG